MASFTESATLEVKDRSTAQIKKINAELKRLQATAASLRSINIQITGIALARRQVQGLIRDMRALRAVTANIKINLTGAAAARAQLNSFQRQLNAIRASAARPINIRTNVVGGGGRGGVPPVVPPATPRRRGGGPSLVGAALQGTNLGGGLGLGMLGLGRLNPAFLAVASAAYIAAAALKSIAKETYTMERAELQLAVGATPEQQIIIKHALERYQKEQHPLDVTPAEFISTAVGMLTDVRGKTAAERARAVGKITPQILDEILPLTFALNPKQTKEQALEGVNTIVKAMNIASSDLTYASGELSKDGMRVLRAMVKAKAINPLVDPERMRATIANMKTVAFTMDENALAVTLAAGGDRGTRVGNEIYRAVQALSGAIDNKALLQSLKNLEIATGGVPKPGRRGPLKGSIQPGSLVINEADLLKTNAYEWIDKVLRPKILQRAERAETAAEKAAGEERARIEAERPGATPEEIEEARSPLRSKIQTEIDKAFATMTMAGRTAIAETIYNMEQRRSTMDQMRDITEQIKGGGMLKIFKGNWAAALQQVITQLKTQSQGLNDYLKKELGITDTLNTMADALKGDPAAQKKAVEQGMEMLKTIAPQFIGQELLLRGATMLLQAAQALYNWIPKKDTAAATVPSGASMSAAGQALEQQIKFEQGILEQLVKKLDAMEKNTRTPDYAKEAIRKRITEQQTVIDALKKDLATSIAGEVRAIIRQEPVPARHEDVWGGAKMPTPAELQSHLDKMGLTSDIILKGPSEFERIFNVLPTKGGEAGTSMGTNTMTTINSGAPGAGEVMGNSFLSVVKGGLAGLNLNVTATVAGQSGGSSPWPDTGARKAD